MKNVFFATAAAAFIALSFGPQMQVANAVELATSSTPLDTSGPYLGYAISTSGRLFQKASKTDAPLARNDAKYECESKAGGICNAFAIEKGVRFIALTCHDGEHRGGYLGAERNDSAMDNAMLKASGDGFSRSDCSVKANRVAGR